MIFLLILWPISILIVYAVGFYDGWMSSKDQSREQSRGVTKR